MKNHFLTHPISFFIEDIFHNAVQKLPWEYPIAIWRDLGVTHLNVKHGIGRHPVVFVQVDGRNFAVKELGFEAAQDWLHNVFVPVCELFKQEGVLDFFPGKSIEY